MIMPRLMREQIANRESLIFHALPHHLLRALIKHGFDACLKKLNPHFQFLQLFIFGGCVASLTSRDGQKGKARGN